MAPTHAVLLHSQPAARRVYQLATLPEREVLPTKGTGAPEFYYQTTLDALQNHGDIFVVLDVLARRVGILGVFSAGPRP